MPTVEQLERNYYISYLGLTSQQAAVMSLTDLRVAFYSNPPSGGGGGTSIKRYSGTVTSGDVALPGGDATRVAIAGLSFDVPAAVGDTVLFIPSYMHHLSTTKFMDCAVNVGGSFVRYASSGSGTPSIEGDPSIYSDSTFVGSGSGIFDFVVGGGDLSGGNVRFTMVHSGTGSGTVYASTNYPFRWSAYNFGAL